MSIQQSQLLLQLSPLRGLESQSYASAPDQNPTAYQTQQLQLMRERFEEEKRQSAEQTRIRQVEEQGRMEREHMQAAAQAATNKAAADAKTLELKRAASAKFAETLGKGDIQGAHALVPYMSQLGMSVNLDGEENGLPRYSIYMSPEEAATGRRLDTLKEENPNPYLPEGAPQTPNKNVIDMPAMHARTLQQLSPYLESAVAARPEEYQDSAKHSAAAVQGLGLPLTESIKLFSETQKAPDELVRAELMAGAQRGDAQARLAETRGQHAQSRRNTGTDLVKDAAGTFNVKDVWERRRQVSLARSVLTNKSGIDDYMAGAGISRMMGERGSTTEQDVARVLGDKGASFIDNIWNRAYRAAMGGLAEPQKRALLGILAKSQDEDERRVFDFLDNVDETMNAPDTDEEVRNGMNMQRNLIVPRDARDEWGKRKKAAKPGEKASEQKPFNMEEDSRAEYGVGVNDDFRSALSTEAEANGVDAEKILPLINKESIGGNPAAANPQSSARGLIQMIDSVAKAYTNPRTGQKFKDADELTQLSAVEQAPIVAQYFKDKGVTKESSAEDYALAVAAPKFIGKSRETVVYPKDSDEWKVNSPWRPTEGGDITVGSILDFYGIHKAEESKPDPKARMRELLQKRGVY